MTLLILLPLPDTRAKVMMYCQFLLFADTLFFSSSQLFVFINLMMTYYQLDDESTAAAAADPLMIIVPHRRHTHKKRASAAFATSANQVIHSATVVQHYKKPISGNHENG